MDTLKKYWENINEKWNKLSVLNKRLIIGASAIFVIVLSVSLFFLLKTNYVQLFEEDVDSTTLSAVVGVLDDNSYKYKLTSTGNNVLVPEDALSKVKLAISGTELPNAKFTWKDAIDTNTLGMTDKDKQNVFLLAAKDSLAADLEMIEGVKSATVNLTLPDDDVFAIKSTQKSQAAVALTLTRTLSRNQIKAIVSHVRMSVEGLTEENISVIDSNANVLFPFDQNDETSSLNQYDKIREERKKIVEEAVKTQLEPLYDDVRVTVNLQMGFDKYIETSEVKSSPLGEDAKVGLIQEQHLASSEGTTTSNGGEPGYGSNDEDISYQLQDNGAESSSSTTESDTIYALNTTTSSLEKEVGIVDLNASSLSVIVYQTKDYDYNTLNKAKTFKDITWKEYKDQIRAESNKLEIPESLIESVQLATGIQSVTINGYIRPRFIEKTSASMSTWMNIVPIVILLGIVIFVAIVLIRKTSSVNVVETEPELSVENLLYSTKQKENDLPEIKEQVSDSYLRIAQFVDEKPELVAQLLRNWINEDI